MLGTLFSNSLLLAGGMVMCFVTSWRLSMLAFTTVGPIYHITQVRKLLIVGGGGTCSLILSFSCGSRVDRYTE